MSGEDAVARVLHAPWPQEVIDALTAFQARDDLHPYTCIHAHHEATRVMVPTRSGWKCPTCGWTQSWVGTESIKVGQFGSDAS